ncbi:hybrid sensor histidine kinase/response regulator [bacterium]|nr:hybrid sensor histidine kinase/response regulator [bacterium]
MELSKEELKEMMAIFKVESEEHLKDLNKGLLKLEETPGSRELLDELFRTAHSIKGAARMMGFSKIETIAHKIEDGFGLLRKGSISLTPEDFDVVYEGVDIISQIIERISTEGTDQDIDVAAISEKLEKMVQSKETVVGKVAEGKDESKKVKTTEEAEPAAITTIDDELKNQEISKPMPQPVAESTYQETSQEKTETGSRGTVAEDAIIRVSTKRLDDLMNQVSELITTRIKSQQRLIDIKKIVELCDEWTQQAERLKSFREKVFNRVAAIESSGNNGSFNAAGKSALSAMDLKTFISFYDAAVDKTTKLLDLLNNLYDKHNEDNMRTSVITGDIQDNLRIIRLMPISTIFDLYPRMVRDIAKGQNKKVKFEIYGADTRVDKKILEELKDPLIHLLRNSIDHGVETPIERVEVGKNPEGTISIRAGYIGNMVQIEVSDDGRGIDTDRIAQMAVKKGYIKAEQIEDVSKSDLISLIFHSGFSTAKIITDLSGRGVGLDVVKANIERIKGTIETDSEKGKGSKFILKIPLTLATTHVLIVDVGTDYYSLPIDYVERTVRLTEEEIVSTGQNPFIMVDEKPVPVYKLEEVLGNPRQRLKNKGLLKAAAAVKTGQHLTKIETNKFPAVVLSSLGRRVAFLVDKLLDEQEVVVKNLGNQLKRVKNVAGSTVLGDGRISLILNPNDLIKSVQGSGTKFVFRERRTRDLVKKRVLVVDDSITTRTLEKNILESAGYHVTTATNGLEGYQKLSEGGFDIVVSDVEMPMMTGFEFAEKVRKESKFQEIPFILCTSLESEKDKRKGIEVGANAYIVKGSFDQSNLLETIEKLL